MFSSLKQDSTLRRYERFLITTLRVSLGVVFVWFGVLKLFGFNPVFDLIFNSVMPVLADGPGLFILGLAEVFIGTMLFANRFLFFTHIILVAHLLGTFTTFVFGWDIVFDPYFPVLTLGGEFVVKNIVLALSGLAVLIQELHNASRV